MKKKSPKRKALKYPNFNLVANTSGIILDGVYVKEDFSEIIVDMAWGGKLHFKPEGDILDSDKRAEIIGLK